MKALILKDYLYLIFLYQIYKAWGVQGELPSSVTISLQRVVSCKQSFHAFCGISLAVTASSLTHVVPQGMKLTKGYLK